MICADDLDNHHGRGRAFALSLKGEFPMQHHFESTIEREMGKILDSLGIQYKTQVELGWQSVGNSCLSRFHCEWKEQEDEEIHCSRDDDHECRWYRDPWCKLYRLDFAIELETGRIAIECDGFEFHKRTMQQIQQDARRDKWLTDNGWTVRHFSGTYIKRFPNKVKRDIQDLLATMTGNIKPSQSTLF
jgi:very-short-patch-repair endonuclease